MSDINARIGTRETIGVVLKKATTTPAPGPSGPDGTWKTNADAFPNMLPIIGWKIWFGDGTSVNSFDQSWEGAPKENVQVVCYYHGRGYRTFSSGCDEYFNPSISGESKLGKLIGDEDFEVIKRAAESDEWRP
jgi:hypothetical protein